MSRKERYIPHRSHSEAVNRRRVLAEHRRGVYSQRIIDTIETARRLAEIDRLLSLDNLDVSFKTPLEREQTRAEWELEKIWLQRKCGMITQEELTQLLSKKFDELEKGKRDVYHWLVDNNIHGPSRAQQIRDSVIPPIRIGGFHTKR